MEPIHKCATMLMKMNMWMGEILLCTKNFLNETLTGCVDGGKNILTKLLKSNGR